MLKPQMIVIIMSVTVVYVFGMNYMILSVMHSFSVILL